MAMSERKRAAVIGAGIAGLEATKCWAEEDFDVTCYEKTGHVAGLWRYHDDDSEGIASVMKTTIINTSKEMGAFSDFPPPAEYANYMHHTQMCRYIESYANKFGLTQYIKFHHETLKIEKADDYKESGSWKITFKNIQTNEIASEVFDCVAVCIGHHTFPNIPTFPGQEKFRGKIIHSHSLKTVQGFDDMRILVVGVGNSGMDAAVELSSVAKQVYLSSRRGAWIFPKLGPSGLPLDFAFQRRYLLIFLRILPYSLICTVTERALNKIFDHELYNLQPKHRVFSQHPTANDVLPIKLLSGTVLTKGNLKMFTSKGVIFEDEEEETEIDAVIFCTGYQVKFSFLDDNILPVRDNRVKLYKHILPPDLSHPTLAVIGLIQPNGAGIPVAEMQCRWASRVMNGKLALPSKVKMYQDIKKKDDFNRKKFTDSPRHTFQVDFLGYQDELAEEIGAKPNFLKLAVTDPRLFWALCFGPSLPYQYRLQGPHAWEGARDAILACEERVKAPLRRHRQKDLKTNKTYFSIALIFKTLLYSLLIIWYLYFIDENYVKFILTIFQRKN